MDNPTVQSITRYMLELIQVKPRRPIIKDLRKIREKQACKSDPQKTFAGEGKPISFKKPITHAFVAVYFNFVYHGLFLLTYYCILGIWDMFWSLHRKKNIVVSSNRPKQFYDLILLQYKIFQRLELEAQRQQLRTQIRNLF